ncbi:methyltransferase domain-containing protein [Candidatus Saccharibacteria bacterium]|nr:methyltransferase domain-containing protein [Candidatus Saccharibacteria bacterium]
MQYLAVLGRQPKISVAELEALFSDVNMLGHTLATFSSKTKPDISRLGGTMKLAQEINERPEEYLRALDYNGKFVIGLSDYSKNGNAKRSQFLALKIKRTLKKQGRSIRVLENKNADLSSATVFHNQLGEKAGHIEFIKYANRWFILIGVQNINAYRDRDQNRPARDAKVGMLPPKLAQILINLCGPLKSGARVLDPFCGTGVVLQEALLMGYSAYGTDASERMVEYAKRNLEWLAIPTASSVEVGDATNYQWQQPIDAVACETYLGPPMSEPPVDIKLKTVEQECRAIIVNFLKNLSGQIMSETPVVVAVPAWLRPDGSYYRLKILDELDKLGYNVVKNKNLSQRDLLYVRAGQIVAREIIVLRKK